MDVHTIVPCSLLFSALSSMDKKDKVMNRYLTRPATPAAIRVAKDNSYFPPPAKELGVMSDRYSFAPMSVEEIAVKGPGTK
jgi:hypothetical protein